MNPRDVEIALGEPDARSQKLNPLLLKYGALELTFLGSKAQPPRLMQMSLVFASNSLQLPDPVSISEWPIGGSTTVEEFNRLLSLHGVTPIERVAGREITLPCGVRATFSHDRLTEIRVSGREHPLFGTVKAFEAELGIPPGFLESLLTTGDDWTFIIKVHALLQAALTHLLVATVGDNALQDRSESLPMTRGLALAVEHRVLDPGRAAFLRALGRLRNAFVHDIRSVSLRIEDFVRTLDPDEQQPFWRDLIRGYTLEPSIDDSGRLIPTEEFVESRPRFAIWISSMGTLSLMYRTKTLDPTGREKLFSALSRMEPLRSKPESRSTRRQD
jgi:hypothetical protein